MLSCIYIVSLHCIPTFTICLLILISTPMQLKQRPKLEYNDTVFRSLNRGYWIAISICQSGINWKAMYFSWVKEAVRLMNCCEYTTLVRRQQFGDGRMILWNSPPPPIYPFIRIVKSVTSLNVGRLALDWFTSNGPGWFIPILLDVFELFCCGIFLNLLLKVLLLFILSRCLHDHYQFSPRFRNESQFPEASSSVWELKMKKISKTVF